MHNFMRVFRQQLKISDSNGLLRDSPLDLATLLAISRVTSLLYPDSCPRFSVSSSIKEEHLGKVPSNANAVYVFHAQHIKHLIGTNEVPEGKFEGIEKFIAVAIATGAVSPETGINFGYCKLVDTAGKCWIYQHFIESKVRYFYTDTNQLRQALSKVANDLRRLNYTVNWETLIKELESITGQHQGITLLAETEVQSAKKDKGHLFTINNAESVVADLQVVGQKNQPATENLANQPAKRFEVYTQMVAKQIAIISTLVEQDKQIVALAQNSTVRKSNEERSLNELVEEYWNNHNLTVGSKDFIVWCSENKIEIEKKDPIFASHLRKRGIKNTNAVVYALDTNIIIDKRSAVAWIFSKANSHSPVEIDEQNAIAWIAENRPNTVIEGIDVISLAITKKVKIGRYSALEWFARSKITEWQGQEKFEWIISKWLRDPSLRISKSTPIMWCLGESKTIGGKNAKDWLAEQNPNSQIFPYLIQANLSNPGDEWVFATRPSINEDSLVWLIKSMPVVLAERIIYLLQEEIRKADNPIKTHVGWLREHRTFDLIGYIRTSKVNIQLDGRVCGDWLRDNAHNLTLSEKDKESLKYDERVEEKLKGFEDCYKSMDGDFWATLNGLQIYEVELVTTIIKKVEALEHGIFNKYNGNVNGLNLDGQAPIHICLGQPFVVQLLFDKYQANPNLKNKDGDTPAHLAASVGSLETLKLLHLKYKADLAAINNNGISVLESAFKDHRPNDTRGRNRMDIIRYLLAQKLQLQEYRASSFFPIINRSPLFYDELLAKNFKGKNVVEIATEVGHEDIVKLFREVIAQRINDEVSGFLRVLYQQVDSDDPKSTIPLVICNPQLAIKFAKECSTILTNYLPYLMGSVFYGGVKAHNIMRCHEKEFPENCNPGSTSTTACTAVWEVFEVIKAHGIIKQIPANFGWEANTHVPSASSTLHAVGEVNAVPIEFTTAIAAGDEGRMLIIISQDTIEIHKKIAFEVFKQLFGDKAFTQPYKNKDAATCEQRATSASAILEGKLTTNNIYVHKDINTNNLFCKFIYTLVIDAQKTVDEDKYKELLSFKMLTRIQELLTGVQIQFGENKGWCKSLEKERSKLKDTSGFFASLSLSSSSSISNFY